MAKVVVKLDGPGDGTLVFPAPDKQPEFTMEQAERSAEERNSRAEKMGLKARYEATE